MLFKKIYVLLIKKMRNTVWRCRQIEKPSLFCFIKPCAVITVSIEYYTFMIIKRSFYQIVYGLIQILSIFKLIGIMTQRFCNSRIYYNICHGY